MSTRLPDTSGALRIVIEPTPTRRKWTARLGDRVLSIAAAPFVQSARVQLAEGYPPDAVIEMWRPTTEEWALRGRIGPVAATLLDGEAASHCAKNGSPVRETQFGEGYGREGRQGHPPGDTQIRLETRP